MLRLCVFSPWLRRSLAPRRLSTCASCGREVKFLPPDERLHHLKTAEKSVAIFAGVSLIVGYFALKFTFREMASKQSERSQAQGHLLVIAGPSGSGKSTLVKKLFQEFPNDFKFSISHTTRKPRSGEVNGREYHFTTHEKMKRSIADGEFIEWMEFCGNMYGTSKQSLRDVRAAGKVCVLDVDMQGVRNMKKTDLSPIYIFIKPPSIEELEKRLRGRKTESEESLRGRLDKAREELEFGETPGVFDHTVVNDRLDEAYQHLKDAVLKDVGIGQKENGTK